MELIPIKQTIEENKEFINHPNCQETIYISVEYYNKVGYDPPWIGYYAKHDNEIIGSAGFKGGPRNGKVEIAYGTFEQFRHQGFGTLICKHLIELSLNTDPSIVITARTLPEKNYSTKILEKNNFEWIGTVMDKEDGVVWEWKYKNT